MSRMPVERRIALLRIALVMLVALGAVSYGAFKTRVGDWTALWTRVALSGVQPDIGAAYTAPTGRAALSSHERPSPAQVLENGQPLGPSSAQQAHIRELGRGRFSFWHDAVYFSTSDNSDPRTNGRRYEIWFPPVSRSVAWAFYLATLLAGLANAWLAWSLRASGKAVWVALGAGAADRIARLDARLRARQGRRLSWGSLAVLWLIVLGLVAASEVVFLTRTAQWTFLWRTEAISDFRPEQGFAYVGHTGRPEIASHDRPEPTALYEDGVQIGLRNALHAEIREVGQGRYSFWHDYVYFATTDNSDPRTNGRHYTMGFPPVSRLQARVLYGASALAVFLVLFVTGAALRNGLLGTVPASVAAAIRRYVVLALVVACTGSLVALAALRALPATAPMVTELWVPVLLLQAVAAWVFRMRWGARVPRVVAAAFLLALCVGFYFLTAWAPQRTQGCHSRDPYPSWDMFCVAPDSSSYYYKYTTGSTRQPLYPWFIEALTAGTGFVPQQYLAAVEPGAIRTDPNDPLMRVVRAQIVLMLIGAVVACAGLMGMLGSTLPAAVVLWIYDMQFFTAEELNIVLTEPLVQAFMLLLIGACAAYFARRRAAFLVAAGAAAGLAYLTRQAAAYIALLMLMTAVTALAQDWRRSWRGVAAAFGVFAALAVVPDVYALVTTGSLGKNQQSLQYQYRIAHAMQYATLDDVALMPDQESREWLADAVPRRDLEHRLVREKYDDEYNRMVYYINANLYTVATPPGGFIGQTKTPEFFMKVATPILVRHWVEYAQFAFRFWQMGLSRPGLARLGFYRASPWWTYAVLVALVLALRDLRALWGATLILAHWGAVALTSLFAVPIPRMVWASEFLVILAALVLVWGAAERAIGPWQGVPAGPDPGAR